MTRWLAACVLFACQLLSFPLQAQVAVPTLSARVTDLTNTLSAEEVASLEQTLKEFEQKKGSQIAVLLVPTTEPETIEQYSIRVVEQWKLGRKGVDDGALLLIAKNDRALRIEVGYGLEGALTDLISKRIISDIMVPHLKEDDFSGGINAGVQAMMTVIDGEPLPEPAEGSAESDDELEWLWLALIFSYAFGGTMRALVGRVAGSAITGSLIGLGAWLLVGTFAVGLIAGIVGFFATLIGIGGGGGGGGGHYSRGGFGGGSGGGFGGGGGGFGGGGASGRF